MHIAVSALSVRANLFGGGTYITNLLRSLASIDSQNHYTVYVTADNLRHFQGLGPRFELVPAYSNRALRVLWEQTGLPGDLRRRRIDLYHGTAFVVPLRRVCPQVTTIHDLTFFLFPQKHTFLKRHYFQLMIPRSALASDIVITVSENTRRDLLRIVGIPPERTRTIHLGIDEHLQPIRDTRLLARVRERYRLPEKFILYLGLIEPRKNLETLVEAYASLGAIRGLCRLVLAGAVGWGQKELFRRIKALGLSEEVHFPGYIAGEDLAGLYSLAEVFVYPSLYEGFGLPVLEAMACGCPVITSNVSSLPEVAGEAAWLVNPMSVEELVQAITGVLSDTEVKQRLIGNGLARSRLFSWERTARETLRVYEEAACGGL